MSITSFDKLQTWMSHGADQELEHPSAYVRTVDAILIWLEAQGVSSIAGAASLHVATLLVPARRRDARRDRKNCDLTIATDVRSA